MVSARSFDAGITLSAWSDFPGTENRTRTFKSEIELTHTVGALDTVGMDQPSS
jgi:hypothetical protein